MTEMALCIIQNQAQSAKLKDIERMLTDLEQFNSVVVGSGPSRNVYLKEAPEWKMGTPPVSRRCQRQWPRATTSNL